MQKNKSRKEPVKMSDSLIIKGEVGRAEIGALVCDVLLLGAFVYNQVFYGLDMWFLILPLLIIGVCLVVFEIIPERYHLTETSLEVWHLTKRIAHISYESVFNLEVIARDGFINLLQENKVKVYHNAGKSKKLTICKPSDVYTFTEELKKRCPEFDDNMQNSKLEVFFKKYK